MTGTPSRTATASPRGGVGRKLKAKLRPEEHEPDTRRSHGGRGSVGARSPMSSGPANVDSAGTWSEGHVSYPGRSACSPLEHQHEQRLRASRRNRPGCRKAHARPVRAKKRATCCGPKAREAARPTMDRQKSADAKVAAAHGGERAEQEAPNRHEAFDA